MRKLWAILWKENYERFTDRTGAIYMFLVPLVMSAIMGLAFSGMTGPQDVTVLDIPVGIVNLDEGGSQGTALGAIFSEALIPSDPASPDADNPLHRLFKARAISNEAEARALVDSGELTAALIIPPDFSASLTPDPAAFAAGGDEPLTLVGHTNLTLYRNPRSTVGWTIFRDVVQGIADGIAAGNIAVGATVSGLVEAIPAHPLLALQLASGSLNETFTGIAQAASQPDANPIRIRQVDVAGRTQDAFDPLATFSPGFAIFFMGFTVTVGSATILREQRLWTLQRMALTPTPRGIILGGKLLGTYVGGLLQMFVLMIAMSLVGLILQGPSTNIWGSDLPAVVALTLAAVAAATGVGITIASFARTEEQAGNLAAFVLFVMGLAGGIFFPTMQMPDFLQFLPRLTFHFWGGNGYTILSQGGALGDVLPNIAALLIMGVVFFVVGLYQFNRRLDI